MSLPRPDPRDMTTTSSFRFAITLSFRAQVLRKQLCPPARLGVQGASAAKPGPEPRAATRSIAT